MARLCVFFAALVALLLLCGPQVRAEPDFPALTGRVVDAANILSLEDEAALRDRLRGLEQKSTDQLVVVTLKSLGGYEIADYAVKLGQHWGIGQKGKDNGVILLIAPKERKIRIEVGYGLEGVVPDVMAGRIIRNRIRPLFRKGDLPGGVRAGVDDLVDLLLGDKAEVENRAQPPGDDGGDSPALWLMVLGWGLFFVRGAFGSIVGPSRGGVIVVETAGHSGGWAGGGAGHGGGFGGGFGGGGGGGFSGGGGGFGGGGASGGW